MINFDLSIECKQILRTPYEGALDLYHQNKKINVGVPYGSKKISVPSALVDKEDLESILGEEKYAGTIGGMFFITKELPKKYRQFAAIHELAEYSAPRGFDVTGLAKHFQAIAVEIGFAKKVLSSEEYSKYFNWRKSVERTNFFQLLDNSLIDNIRDRIDEIFKSMLNHLTYKKKKLVKIIQSDSRILT